MLEGMSWCQEELPGIVDPSELLRSCQKFLGSIGVTDVSHLKTNLMGHCHVQTTYPEKWLCHYTENALHEVDPAIPMGRRQPSLVEWQSDGCRHRDADFFEKASSFGVPRQGATVTFTSHTGISAFSLASDQPKEEWVHIFEAHKSELNLIAMAYCIKASQLNGTVHLTPREKEVLLWAARGKTSWETAKLLALSEATVNQHLRNTMAKLDASNRVHCVAKAIDMGLLHTVDL